MVVAEQPTSLSHSEASWAPAPKLNAQHTLAAHRGTSVRAEELAGIRASPSGGVPVGPARAGGRLGPDALEPVFDERRQVRPAEHARAVRFELRPDLAVQVAHAGPVLLRVPVVLLVVAVVEPEEVVQGVVRANRVGVRVARLRAVVLQVALR